MLTSSYLVTLLLTLIIEILVAFVFGYRNKFVLLSIIFVNLITNPLLNCILWLNTSLGFFTTITTNLILLEILVVIAEWLLLVFALRQSFKSLLLLSLTMNFVSFSVGLVLR